MSNWIEKDQPCFACKQVATFYYFDHSYNCTSKECQKCLSVFDSTGQGGWKIKIRREFKGEKK